MVDTHSSCIVQEFYYVPFISLNFLKSQSIIHIIQMIYGKLFIPNYHSASTKAADICI